MEVKYNNYYNMMYLNLGKELTGKITVQYEQDIIKVYNDNILIITANYELCGHYNIINSTYIWSWGNPYVEKDLIQSIIKLKDLKNILYKNDTGESDKILYYIDNPVFFIKNIDYLIKLILYHTDGLWIIKDVKNNDIIELILIKNILQFNK